MLSFCARAVVILTQDSGGVPRWQAEEATVQAAFLACSSLFSLRDCTSPSASHRLAFISCTPLMNCLAAMTGKLVPAMTQGQKLSILLALAKFERAGAVGVGEYLPKQGGVDLAALVNRRGISGRDLLQKAGRQEGA